MDHTFLSMLPPIYVPFLPKFFQQPPIPESKATCAKCAMCPPLGTTTTQQEALSFFLPNTKCCTYHPSLPNYLVGGILQNTEAHLSEGSQRVLKKLEQQRGVNPYWLSPPDKYVHIYRASRVKSFGRTETLLCPYYEQSSGNCSVWQYRDSVCSSFFCKHDAGEEGNLFWKAFARYLTSVESKLARYALRQVAPELEDETLNVKAKKTILLGPEELEERPPHPAEYKAIWKDWVGREKDFFVQCYQVVQGIDRATFEDIKTEQESQEYEEIEQRYNTLQTPVLPPRLIRNPEMQVQDAIPGYKLVISYSRFDVLMLPEELVAALEMFTKDRSIEEARQEIAQRYEIEFEDESLIELYQYRLLTTPDDDENV
ncbi:MAG: hypothetical protein H6728_07195 [Myxococcales bacterium]|nr:hypothetical protein [Myxococcales bacterium]